MRSSQHMVLLGLSGRRRPEPGEKGLTATWAAPLKAGRAGGPGDKQAAHGLPSPSFGEGTNAHVAGRGLVCSGRCMAARADLVWLEEVLAGCWPGCPGSGSAGPLGSWKCGQGSWTLMQPLGPMGRHPEQPGPVFSPLPPTPPPPVLKRWGNGLRKEEGSAWGHRGETAAGLGVPLMPGGA